MQIQNFTKRYAGAVIGAPGVALASQALLPIPARAHRLHHKSSSQGLFKIPKASKNSSATPLRTQKYIPPLFLSPPPPATAAGLCCPGDKGTSNVTPAGLCRGWAQVGRVAAVMVGWFQAGGEHSGEPGRSG